MYGRPSLAAALVATRILFSSQVHRGGKSRGAYVPNVGAGLTAQVAGSGARRTFIACNRPLSGREKFRVQPLGCGTLKREL